MQHSLTHVAVITALLGCAQASAQFVPDRPIAPPICPPPPCPPPPCPPPPCPPPPCDNWRRGNRMPDVIRLDSYADQLAQITQHLREDAHSLSDVFIRKAAIELYADQLDRLQQHMHQILHQAVATGVQTPELIQFVREDFRQVKVWMNRLSRELRQRGHDGAQVDDLRIMAHMRELIITEAGPLLQRIERELVGFAYRSYDRRRRRPYAPPIPSPIWHRVGYFAQP